MIRKRIAEHTFETPNGSFRVTCSFGVAEWMKDEPLADAIKHAEAALKLAKKHVATSSRCSRPLPSLKRSNGNQRAYLRLATSRFDSPGFQR